MLLYCCSVSVASTNVFDFVGFRGGLLHLFFLFLFHLAHNHVQPLVLVAVVGLHAVFSLMFWNFACERLVASPPQISEVEDMLRPLSEKCFTYRSVRRLGVPVPPTVGQTFQWCYNNTATLHWHEAPTRHGRGHRKVQGK